MSEAVKMVTFFALVLAGVAMSIGAVWDHRRKQKAIRTVPADEAFMTREQKIYARVTEVWWLVCMLYLVHIGGYKLGYFGFMSVVVIWAVLHAPISLGLEAFKKNPKSFSLAVMVADTLFAAIVATIFFVR